MQKYVIKKILLSFYIIFLITSFKMINAEIVLTDEQFQILKNTKSDAVIMLLINKIEELNKIINRLNEEIILLKNKSHTTYLKGMQEKLEAIKLLKAQKMDVPYGSKEHDIIGDIINKIYSNIN